jgi:hypothetical protein
VSWRVEATRALGVHREWAAARFCCPNSVISHPIQAYPFAGPQVKDPGGRWQSALSRAVVASRVKRALSH